MRLAGKCSRLLGRHPLDQKLGRHLLEQRHQVEPDLVWVILAEVVPQLVAHRELLLAHRALEGRLDDVLDGLELAPALASVHHPLHLHQAGDHLQFKTMIDR